MSGYDEPKNDHPKAPPPYESHPHEPPHYAAPPQEPPPYGSHPSPPYGSHPQELPPRMPPPHVPPPAGPLSQIPGRAQPYALLTREITGFSGQGIDSSGGAAGDGTLGSTVTQALQQVLGWKIKRDNPKGFMSALTQSFSLTVFEGHVQSKWTPRGYEVLTDLSGSATLAGAQASLYTMAKTILDQALPLLDSIYPLRSDFDDEYATVLKQTAASQLRSIVSGFGFSGGPPLLLVNANFKMLAGIPIDANGVLPAGQVEFWKDPDQVGGTLGFLRKELGLGAFTSTYINNLADEENVTKFRVINDYMNAIFNSWLNNLQFFTTMQSPFLGTQLVWITKQLGVVQEAVEELKFVLDSVFIGSAERATLVMTGLKDGAGNGLPSTTLGGLLQMVESLVTQDGPDMIQTGGKFVIGADFSVMVEQLKNYVSAVIAFAEAQKYSALNTDRVLVALYKLQRQLEELQTTAAAVGIAQLPPPSAQAIA